MRRRLWLVATWPYQIWRWLEEPIPDENDWSFM